MSLENKPDVTIGKKQVVTARDVDHVRCWIETSNHHICRIHPRKVGFMQLIGHWVTLDIDSEIWIRCFTKPGEHHDSRMYRWDHEAELKAM